MEGRGGKEEERNGRLSKNENSARLGKSRAVFVSSDLLCYYISILEKFSKNQSNSKHSTPPVARFLHSKRVDSSGMSCRYFFANVYQQMHKLRCFLNQGVSTNARRKIPRAPFRSRFIWFPSASLIMREPPIFLTSPVHETVLEV
jgi:hypothetical protein